MIDENVKKRMLAKLQKVLKDWSKEITFTEPRPRWFRLAKAEDNGVHYLMSISVGVNESETWEMANELVEWHKRYVVDQKDVREEDYIVRKY